MSKKFEIKLDGAGIRAVLKSQEVQSMLTEKASAIRNRCGEGYTQSIYVGKNRANAMVSAETYEAMSDNAKNNTILKAVGN